MKITFDLSGFDPDRDRDELGELLRLFLTHNGGHPHRGRDMAAPGWSVVPATPHRLKVDLMGDGVYEGFEPTHIRHDETGLESLWFVDGDLVLMFHAPGESGFTISNSHNGHGDNWFFHDPYYADPRYDPDHRPQGL